VILFNATLLGQRGIKGEKKDFPLLTRNSIIRKIKEIEKRQSQKDPEHSYSEIKNIV
jgi:hypothetical protein